MELHSGVESAALPQTRTVAVIATTLASLLARVSSLVSQVIVGLFLTEEQFGVYALGLGVLGVTGIWRNGGSATYFPSVKPDRFDEMAAPLFAWASIFGLATAALTVAFGASLPLLPSQFDRFRADGLFAVLLVLAAQTAIRPVSLLGRMRLSVSLEFASLARLDAGLALLRVCLTWIVAREGGGVLALALPLATATLIEAFGLGFMGGFRRTDFVPRHWDVRQLWPALAWPLAFAVMNSIRADILFLLVGLMVPAAVLGTFYFAYQLANQPTMFIGSALQNVLAPLTARDRGDPDAERRTIERTLATSMLLVPVTTMAAASFFPPAERLLWAGKWASADASLYWLCAAATYSTVALLLAGALLGLQRFKVTAGFEGIKMAGALGGALAAGLVLQTGGEHPWLGLSQVTLVAACVSAGMIVSALTQIVWVARTYHLGAGDTVRHLGFGPALSALTAIAATSIATSVDDSLGIPQNRLGALYELATVAGTYSILITLAVRFTAEGTLREAIDVLPAPAAKVLRRVLVLN